MNSSRTATVFSLVVLLALATYGLLAQQNVRTFEGEIIFKIQDTEQVSLFSCLVKGDRMRISSVDEIDNAPMYYIDFSSNKVFAVNNARERLAEYALNPSGIDPASVKIEKQEATEDIAEISCVQYSYKGKTTEIEFWAAKTLGGLGGFHLAMSGKGYTYSPWEIKLAGMGSTALRSIERDADGREVLRFEVIRVEERRLSDMLLKIPAGFEKVEFNRLMRR